MFDVVWSPSSTSSLGFGGLGLHIWCGSTTPINNTDECTYAQHILIIYALHELCDLKKKHVTHKTFIRIVIVNNIYEYCWFLFGEWVWFKVRVHHILLKLIHSRETNKFGHPIFDKLFQIVMWYGMMASHSCGYIP